MNYRDNNLHRIGSLLAALARPSRARVSLQPLISKSTLPGLIGAIHPSGLPLPFPIRTSRGFDVYDLCGKILIHTLPRRFI